MRTFTFSDQEAAELASFYQHKLEEAQKRLEAIQGILGRINVEEAAETSEEETLVEEEVVIPQETVAAQEQEIVSEVEESTEVDDEQKIELDITEYHWDEFILNTFNKNQCVYSMAEVVDMGIKCYNLNKDERGKISKKLTPFFTQLLKNDEIRKFTIEGQSGYFYGPSDWFLKNGRVKKPYIVRFIEDKKRAKKDLRFHENSIQNFIADTLFEIRELKKYDYFYELAKDEFGFPESDNGIFESNLKDEIKRMIEEGNLVEYSVPGEAEVHYALPSWFKTNNELRKPFVTW